MGAIFIIIVNKLLINCGRIFKNMIAKKNILDSKMFQKAFNRGKFLHSKNFIFKFIPNNLKYSRFGIAIGVKVSKKANIRKSICFIDLSLHLKTSLVFFSLRLSFKSL